MNRPEYSILTDYFKGNASHTEVAEVERWSAENNAEFKQLQSTWDEFGSLANSYQPNLGKAWERIDQQTSDESLFSRTWVIRIAAILVLGLGITWYVGFNDQFHKLAEAQTITAGKVKSSTSLADQSSIILSPKSSAIVKEGYGSTNRTVQLTGKAFFDVTKNKDLPFIIEVGDTKIKVLGTSFLVNDDTSKLELIVEEGIVSFGNGVNHSLVNKGEKVVYQKATKTYHQEAYIEGNCLSLKTGKLHFKNTDIHIFAKDLAEYYQIQLSIDPSLANRRITTSFDNQELDEVIQIIETTLSVKVESLGTDSYLIK